MTDYLSWGQYPKHEPDHVIPMRWRHQNLDFVTSRNSVLPYGLGRSYGDSCLNDRGVLLATKEINRLIHFDEQRGIVQCEAGISLADLLDIFVPRGWFIPVTPGTKHVTVGGAIANDVHGKNHHRAGTFGCHVLAFELLRSTGERFTCTPSQHTNLFRATIGGLGLTGLITWATIQLKPITGPMIASERIRFSNLEEFFDISDESDEPFEYTVAWIDCLAKGRNLGRGIFHRGNHALPDTNFPPSPTRESPVSVPFNAPSFLLNPFSIKIFNRLYYHLQCTRPTHTTESYDTFFYPLDGIKHWNRLYGARGFLQYQCVVPSQYEREGIREILRRIQHSQQGSFLAVLKKFGQVPSPGLLSFPRPGTTLALDFPLLGDRTFSLLTKLDDIVRETGGAVYPAKDARMTAQDFQTYFPKLPEFMKDKDPKFSSSFWRRVTTPIPGDSSGTEESCSLSTNMSQETVVTANA